MHTKFLYFFLPCWNAAPNVQHVILTFTKLSLQILISDLVHQNKSPSLASFPQTMATHFSQLSSLASLIYCGMFLVEEGCSVSGVVNHWQSICPVQRLLQDTSGVSARADVWLKHTSTSAVNHLIWLHKRGLVLKQLLQFTAETSWEMW